MNNTFDRKQFGRYKIVKLLGRGSMSTVYMAIDPLLGREVAIKVIHPQLSRQTGFLKRFEREAVALARLEHPNVIEIFDMGQEEELFYMVIKYLPGGTLKDLLQPLKQSRQFMPLQQVYNVLLAICNAVDYIHQEGYVHRDLKPSNVMFDDQEQPMLADFGIVKIIGAESFTVQGGILGTPFYMSPEQFTGDSIDHRSDIYALGVMLYEMCTSNLPFRGSAFADIIKAQLHQQPISPEQINPSIPPAASSVVLRALAKSPDARFQAASELTAAFSTALPPHLISRPKGITKDTLPISDTSPGTKAYLKSLASGARYKLQASSDNRIGRSIPGRGVEIDLSDEQGSEYLHSLHAVARYSTSGWELEIPANTENPVYLNNKKIKPGERVILKSGDRLAFSVTKLIVEIS